ncbi:MAG: LacI family transcriptional regulator [Opitutaceae bacterium]|jgi:DNA-binding LacI/PurR family transcriptional regulator|nr:LacI family transcriptional regulator [Opitutaceae bacterium]
MKQPTMQMIADKAGVSLMTVSRALKNNPRLSLATRERIREIATELGYRPNPLVSALMAQLRHAHAPKVWPTIAFLTSHTGTHVFVEGETYLGAIFAGASHRAATLGYKLERFSLVDPHMNGARMGRMLRTRGILGVILAPLPDPIPVVDFDWTPFACATVGYSYKEVLLHRSVNDQFSSMRLAMSRLHALGYQRVGLAIRHEDDSRTEGKWTGAFWSFHSSLPEARRVPIFLWHEWQPTGFDTWVNTHRPDAVITLHADVREWLHKLDRHPPRNIGLVSLNIQGDQATFSGIDQNNAILGGTAVELVVEQIHHNEHGVPARAKTVMMMGDWVAGATTRQQKPLIHPAPPAPAAMPAE